MKKEINNEESSITELLKIAQVLRDNGVNLKDVPLTNMQNGRQVLLKLSEIKQEGIDIDKIIKENRLK